MKAIIKSLNLPTTFKVIQYAKGNMVNGKYVEIASLHSGTGGHVGALARLIDGAWTEISVDEYKKTAREIFGI